MRKLSAFVSVSLDGYFADVNGELGWSHKSDPEWNEFVEGNASHDDGVLVLGRVTYQMMASYWPTPAAQKNNPVVAEGMNKLNKVVFSRTLDSVSWANTRLVKSDLVGEIARLKKESGSDMVILGSGSIVSQLSQAGSIDELQIVVNPVVLGDGKKLFQGIAKTLGLRLSKERSFGNGNVVLYYEPTA